jgi:F420-dependent oxidoreductase-like protein
MLGPGAGRASGRRKENIMRLGVFLTHDTAVPVAETAERLGYEIALAPEGFKSDAVSVLGAVAARTRRIALGSGVMQIPARTPVLAALTAATLDGLSGRRFRLGLGVSNPDVSYGWYGVPYDRPLARTREYVRVVRTALRGEEVRHAGRHYRLPPDGDTEPARLHAAPVRADIPVYLAAVGPASLELAGEIADGWIGVFCSPSRVAESLRYVRTGRERVGLDLADFEVLPSVPIAVGDDPHAAADAVRGYFANFIGLGSRDRSVYHRLVTRMGFGPAADEVRARLRAGDRAGAAKAVPFELIDRTSLLGSAERIAGRLSEYARAGVTTVGLTPLAAGAPAQTEALRVAARALTLCR